MVIEVVTPHSHFPSYRFCAESELELQVRSLRQFMRVSRVEHRQHRASNAERRGREGAAVLPTVQPYGAHRSHQGVLAHQGVLSRQGMSVCVSLVYRSGGVRSRSTYGRDRTRSSMDLAEGSSGHVLRVQR